MAMTEGENETLGRLMATMLEAFLKWLVGAGMASTKDMQATRRVNRYALKDTVKHADLRAVAAFVGVDTRKVTTVDMLKANLHRFRVVMQGAGVTMDSAADLLVGRALSESAGFRRAVAGYVALSRWTATAAAEKESMRRLLNLRTGMAIEDVPEGMTVASEEAALSLGLEVGDLVRHVLIEQASALRDGFVALRSKLSRDGVSFVDASAHTLRGQTLEDYSEARNLAVNATNLGEWVKHSVFTVTRYCSPCKRAGRYATPTVQQVKKAGNACPTCGVAARFLGRNDNTGHLPMVTNTTANGGVRVTGGHRLHFTSVVFSKRAFNLLADCAAGDRPADEVIKALLAMPKVGTVRTQVDGRTMKVAARLVPVWFEVNTNGMTDAFGLAVERVQKA
jgi:hypothetical protein